LNETRGGVPSSSAAKLGAELRTVRQNLGWDLGDLARSLRIRQAYLEAIEAGRISDLPGTTYALGFVRAYASALGLQGEQVASRFRAESAEANIRPALSFPAPVPQRGVPAGALMLLGLVVLAGAYSGWYWISERQHTPAQTVPPIPDQLQPAQEKPTPSPQVASLLPSASPPTSPPAPAPVQPKPAAMPQVPGPVGAPAANSAAPAPMPAVQTPSGLAPAVQVPPAAPPAPSAAAPAAAAPPGTRILVKATADAWVTVKPKGGAAIFNKLMHAGDTWPVPVDKTGLLLTTGNAGGTEIDVDGTSVAGVGGSGMVRRDLPLDPDMLKSGHLPPIVHGKPKPAADVDNG
jgi:cytoskeleton protein RodZ